MAGESGLHGILYDQSLQEFTIKVVKYETEIQGDG